MNEVKGAAGRILRFADQLHYVVGAGATEGSMDARNLPKPVPACGSSTG